MHSPIDWALLFLRSTSALLLLHVHGLLKLLRFSQETQLMKALLGLGGVVTLCLAIFAEVLCPLVILLGMCIRTACLPILMALLVSLLLVHPDWSLAEDQAGWLLIIFTTLAISGPGFVALGRRFAGARARALWLC
ncbi:DoxX family membrane protein [Pseudomonas sp. R-28-1W-6]|uniref:DoxX family membrane protein n=1 Tax=Pseudomonas sp. R-28-1W-6 TaxID=2650101 RepID=UPI001365AFB0|nr:DoxX family membrane protein [Pseudomonas sp. R-28-1W-6]MWV11718.1 DoxX family membrane protein [Pseudomonas sp. R-28-1W-6]